MQLSVALQHFCAGWQGWRSLVAVNRTSVPWPWFNLLTWSVGINSSDYCHLSLMPTLGYSEYFPSLHHGMCRPRKSLHRVAAADVERYGVGQRLKKVVNPLSWRTEACIWIQVLNSDSKGFGAMFNEEGSCDHEIGKRIGVAMKMMGALRSQVIKFWFLNFESPWKKII